ncbi:uncharacterized protein LOC127881674 isoform X1 [Dreissena polymorpha]|uniref:Chitin-binding type-2 domain-containing protein n=1 Tax=Dreissena polymorpha TaxID=45954 RepID=A0A9D4GLM4_DREPO|nr:uncharacterized protein LOC127881674 isoform X1 [Dreissena polymorpha]XP_052285734.1 uncharacterized protein LOC127881674 isoform X1 [Dreissena polymorpha]XP_052285735.1 uncharacterized protein LOC127881674 isoform X1 [Dreissena polymorpha]XP_052285736.1 uncharacterized protein LOC127881674 isoform X1 [Dreissena polymorpha]KAH3819691.1 hypothetical protein DPMN_121434 [Dreissena polymorpha]
MTSSDPRYFNGLCEKDFDLARCNNATELNQFRIDPCNCTSYYQCSQSYAMNKQSCSSETAFDPEMNCISKNEVFFKIRNVCEKNHGIRCNTTTERLAELRALCTNTGTVSTTTTTTTEQATVTVSTTTTTTPEQVTEEGSKTNSGMVIGLIVAGIAIAVIAILLLLFVRRWRLRKQTEKAKNKRPKSAMKVEHLENVGANEPNDTIPSDTNPDTMGDSSYYNNYAFNGNKSDTRTDQDGYTTTFRRSLREYERPTNMHRAINEDVNETDRSNIHQPNVDYVNLNLDTTSTK